MWSPARITFHRSDQLVRAKRGFGLEASSFIMQSFSNGGGMESHSAPFAGQKRPSSLSIDAGAEGAQPKRARVQNADQSATVSCEK